MVEDAVLALLRAPAGDPPHPVRRAAYDAPKNEYEELSVLPMPIDQQKAPSDLLQE